MKKNKIIIIGGGIAGLASAYYLLKAGFEVAIIDKGDFKNNCSYVNAGMIVPSHFTPLAAPGIVSQGVRWLFNKKSPFYIKPSIHADLVKWGKTFIRYANKEHVESSALPILTLNLFGKEQYKKLYDSSDFNFTLIEDGILMLYRTEKTKKEQLEEFEKARQFNMDCQILSNQEIKALEPELEVDVLGGVLYKTDAIIRPAEVMAEFLREVQKRGAVFFPNEAIREIEIRNGVIQSVASASQTFSGDQFVLATGGALSQLAKKAGLNIPVMPGKGYSFMTNVFKNRLRYAALLLDDKVSVTPMGEEVRIGGTMELGTEDPKIKIAKLKGMVEGVNQYYPGIRLSLPQKEQVNYGFRPCSPDGLPYLGKTQKINNLYIAGGAGMMGMSSGPALGKVISELIQNQPLSIKIDMFDPERFN